MFKSLHELSRQGASGTFSHRGFRSLFLLLTALLLCSTVSLAATDWQARMAQCSAAAVQAAAQEAPEGLTLSQEELALYRLGFAQGFDAPRPPHLPRLQSHPPPMNPWSGFRSTAERNTMPTQPAAI